jgi:zinc protease
MSARTAWARGWCVRTAAVAALVACAASAGAQTRWPSEGPPRPLPARQARFPEYHLRTLPNGLRVIAVLHHEQPVVSMRMIVKAGGALDPAGKLGLANLANALLTQGTETQSANEMNEAIDFIGGAMGAGAGIDLSSLNVLVMKDSYETGLRMLSDMARRPAFAQEEIERQRQQMLSSLQVSLQDPGFIADSVFRRLVYGFHPYAWPHSGTPETLAAITREDLLAFHRRNFVANNAILAVVGDLTAEEAFAGVTKVFGDWQRGDIPADPFTAPPDPTRRVIVINKPDAVQTEVRVGHIGVRRNHPDYMALNLALRILGGEGANRLYQVLRTERGLTYSAEADFRTLFDSGDFEASTSTRTEATGEALRLIVDEFWRLQRERVSERELADAKAYLAGSFPLTIEVPDAIATQVLNVVFFGLPVEDLQSFRERVNAVTPDDVQRVAKQYLHPERLAIVLVGNAPAFASQLRPLGFTQVETIEAGELDLTSTSLRRQRAASVANRPRVMPAAFVAGEAGRQSPRVVPQEGAEARALLDEVIAAKGGLDTLRNVKTIVARTREVITPPPGRGASEPVTGNVVTYIEYPNKVRVETDTPAGHAVQVFDGSRGWVSSRGGTIDLPRPALAAVETALSRDTIMLLLAAARGDVRVRRLPDVKDESGAVNRALEFSSPKLDPVVLQIASSGLPVKQTYVVPGAGQPLVEEIFEDYRPVGGIQLAHAARLRQSGATLSERIVTSIEINSVIAPALFKRPNS